MRLTAIPSYFKTKIIDGVAAGILQWFKNTGICRLEKSGSGQIF
jgi:hypothetical protein